MYKRNFSVGKIIKITSIVYACVSIIMLIVIASSLYTSYSNYEQLRTPMNTYESNDYYPFDDSEIDENSDMYMEEKNEYIAKETLTFKFTLVFAILFALFMIFFTTILIYGFGELLCRSISIDEKLPNLHRRNFDEEFELE